MTYSDTHNSGVIIPYKELRISSVAGEQSHSQYPSIRILSSRFLYSLVAPVYTVYSLVVYVYSLVVYVYCLVTPVQEYTYTLQSLQYSCRVHCTIVLLALLVHFTLVLLLFSIHYSISPFYFFRYTVSQYSLLVHTYCFISSFYPYIQSGTAFVSYCVFAPRLRHSSSFARFVWIPLRINPNYLPQQ